MGGSTLVCRVIPPLIGGVWRILIVALVTVWIMMSMKAAGGVGHKDLILTILGQWQITRRNRNGEMDPERRLYCTYCDDYGHNITDHKDSGPMCVCGHFEDNHHRSWFAVTEFTPNGGKLIEECEYYGHNETGGAMQNAEGKWIDHCQRFKEAK